MSRFSLTHYLRSQLFLTLPDPAASFAGKTVLITGSNTGIGLAAARLFARQSASRLILAVRDVTAGAEAAQSISTSEGVQRDQIEVWHLDLCSYDSVKQFGRDMRDDRGSLHVAVMNAGVMTADFEMAEDNERTITVNVVNTMFLALLLMPKLSEASVQSANDSSMVFTSSFTHHLAKFEERNYEKIVAGCADKSTARMENLERYYVSKLIELFAIRALASAVSASSNKGHVVVTAVNPGYVDTSLTRDMSGVLGFLLGLSARFVSRTPAESAKTLVHAAGSGREVHGTYMDNCGISKPSMFVVSETGQATQRRIWQELVEKFESLQQGIMQTI